MNNIDNTEEEISRYLLGQCSDEECIRIEGRCLSDDGFLDLVLQAEEELIDAYEEERLPDGQRKHFENYYLVTNERREKVAFARSLRARLQLSAAATGSRASSRSQARQAFSGLVAFDKRWLAVAASVIGLLLITCSWLIIRTARLQGDLAASGTTIAEQKKREDQLQQQIAEERARNEQLAGQVEELRNREDQAPTDTDIGSARIPAIPMIVLTPLNTRDAGKENILVLEPNAKGARLRLFFRDADHKSYKTTLRNATGEKLWSAEGIRAVLRGASKSVDVVIPGAILESANYMLTLSGVTNAREQDVSDYQFRVVRQ